MLFAKTFCFGRTAMTRRLNLFHILEGELDVVIFDDHGKPLQTLRMGPFGSGKIFYYRLNASFFHALLPRTAFVVFHETTAGPFVQNEAIFAPWAPTDPSGLRKFIEELMDEHIISD